jgi:hypothetical protein
VAALRGDATMYAAQRQRAAPIVVRPPVQFTLADSPMPWARKAEILSLVDSLEQIRFTGIPVGPSLAVAAIVAGRPDEARRVMDREPDSLRVHTDVFTLAAALFGDGNRDALDAALTRLRAARVPGDTTILATRAACLLGLWGVSQGEMTQPDSMLLHRQPRCAAVLEAARAGRVQRADARDLLLAADSAARVTAIGDTGFEAMTVARLWEESGDLPRALRMMRVRAWGFSNDVGEAVRSREEGRLAVMTGDTAGAIRAWQRYLLLRRDAEPSLIPQRDSVRAQLDRLTRS